MSNRSAVTNGAKTNDARRVCLLPFFRCVVCLLVHKTALLPSVCLPLFLAWWKGMESIIELFTRPLTIDDRKPVVSWQVASYQLDIYAPMVEFLLQVTLSILLQILVGLILNVATYYLIVQRTPPKTPAALIPGTLFGYCIVFPTVFYFPYWCCIHVLNVQSKAIRLGWCTLPVMTCLTTTEALYGFTPLVARRSLKDFLLYSSLMMRPKYVEEKQVLKAEDSKIPDITPYVPSTAQSMGTSFRHHLLWIAVVTLCLHVFGPLDYKPFPTMNYDPATSAWFVLDPGLMYNTYIQGAVLSFTLSMSWTGISTFLQAATGVQFEDKVADFPVFLSKSPSDFWSRRWNNIIHYRLKQGVYKPVRWHSGSSSLAIAVVFVVSGVLHEWIGWFIFLPTAAESVDIVSNYYKFGKITYFFCHCASGLVLEEFDFLYRWFFDMIGWAKVPVWIKAHALCLSALPVAHVFLNDVIDCGYMRHLELYTYKFVLTKVDE